MEDTDSPKRLFLVEGNTDKAIISSILEKLGVSNMECREHGGIDKLLKGLTASTKESNVRSIGIIVDANRSWVKRWQSIRDRLYRSDLKISLPKTPCSLGTVCRFESQRIGIWVMPDNQTCGMLEDFVSELIPKNDVWKLACDFVESAEDKVPAVSKSKSQVYAWLAIVAPGTKMGTVFRTGKLEFDTTNYKNFENWIKELCE